jgi:hypothetical protein
MAEPLTTTNDCRRMEAGFAWIERTVQALDDSKLSHTIYQPNKGEALKRIRALRDDVLFLYHALGLRDEHP